MTADNIPEARKNETVVFFRRLFRRRVVLIGAIILFIMVFLAVLGNFLAPHPYFEIKPIMRLQTPSGEHFLGTDHLGRDILSRIIIGSRFSLLIGSTTIIFSIIFGILIGIYSAYYTWADNLIMRIMDALMAFPAILLAIVLMAALGPSLVNIIIALSVVFTPRIARVVRSQALVIKRTEFIEAGHALGLSSPRIIFRHILPNCLSPVIVQGTFLFAQAVLNEAALSFLGAGIPPEIPSWGLMLSEARPYLIQAPWIAIFPGLAIMFTVLSLNMVGDGLRDTLDPRLKNF